MKKNAFLPARLAGLFAAVALLATCYAPTANQNGYLNLGISSRTTPINGTPEIVVMVVNSGYQDTLAEMLNIIGKSHYYYLNSYGSIPQSDKDRLKTLAKELAASGLVNFGGFPFYQTTIGGSSGSFQIPGVPAGRDYFVKIFVFNPGVSFSTQKLDENFWTLLQLENLVFTTETYLNDTAWQSWTPIPGQPVAVNAGQAASINVALVPPP